jgi:hypothetical protein
VTKACRPAHPEVLVAFDVLKEEFSVKWEPPADHGAAITEYELIMVDTNECADLEKHINAANECNYVNQDPDAAMEFAAEECNEAVWKVLSAITLKSKVRPQAQDAQDPNAPTHTFTDLLGGIAYEAAVRAYNSEGWSDWSAVMTVQTPSAKPEQCPPMVLLETQQTNALVQYRVPYDNGTPLTGVEFYWTRVLGPIDRHKARVLGGVADDHKYDVSRTIDLDIAGTGGPERAPPHGIGGTGTCLVEGLEPGTDYDIQVRAKNMHDFGPFSPFLRFQTAPGRPDKPEGVHHGISEPSGGLPEEAPTVCFGKTARLQSTEVVHVRQGKVKQAILDTLSPTPLAKSLTEA